MGRGGNILYQGNPTRKEEDESQFIYSQQLYSLLGSKLTNSLKIDPQLIFGDPEINALFGTKLYIGSENPVLNQFSGRKDVLLRTNELSSEVRGQHQIASWNDHADNNAVRLANEINEQDDAEDLYLPEMSLESQVPEINDRGYPVLIDWESGKISSSKQTFAYLLSGDLITVERMFPRGSWRIFHSDSFRQPTSYLVYVIDNKIYAALTMREDINHFYE